MIRRVIYSLLATLVCTTIGVAQDSKKGYSPSITTQQALSRLKSTNLPSKESYVPEKSLEVNVRSAPSMGASVEVEKKALVVPNSMLIQLEPNLTIEEIEALAEEKDFGILDVYENIGQIRVEVDLSEFFNVEDEPNENLALLKGFIKAAKHFKSDPRILAATPETFLSTKSNHGADDQTPALDTDTETEDWGLDDINAKQLWQMPNSDNGVLFGVMDVGFAPHEDIVYKDLAPPDELIENDHGNHVSAIACAKHNGTGVKGVLPECFVKARHGKFFEVDGDPDAILEFNILFSQIIATLNDFLLDSNEISTYNISLGYNWIPNFQLNPDSEENELFRNIVQIQGEMFLSILEQAQAQGKVVFSAAGNDSSNSVKIDSKFASPFNWAAHVARERDIGRNGVVVEAHDINGSTASFSNINGHISCPGVDILSATAQAVDSYKEESGTSMASPYCAGGFALLQNVLGESEDPSAILECMEDNAEVASSGTPKLKLMEAFNKCSVN